VVVGLLKYVVFPLVTIVVGVLITPSLQKRMEAYQKKRAFRKGSRAKENYAKALYFHEHPRDLYLKCPRLLYQSRCEFSVDISAGMRSGAGDGV
jgi:hypothetical protein